MTQQTPLEKTHSDTLGKKVIIHDVYPFLVPGCVVSEPRPP